MKRLTELLYTATVALVLTLSAPASAGTSAIGPEIPNPVKGEQCVEPTDVMRRNHMDYLKHQRDETMRRGIRTTKYSLKECLDCHVPATYTDGSDEGHFCMNCHKYTGVSTDCFQCHNTKPTSAIATGAAQ